jgi:peptidoglycan/LPS O-acetylase OafA/YrhL
MKISKQEKIKYLEGLRGLAALIVVTYHHFYGFFPMLLYPSKNKLFSDISASPINILYNGHFAVYVFFVLSGFVLSYKFFKFKDFKILTSSAARRYIRLLPPVLFSILASYFLLSQSLFFNKEASIISKCCLATYFSFNANIFNALYDSFISSFFINGSPYNIVLWTIKYEMLGSFFVFAIAGLFGQLKNRFVFYIIILLLTIYNPYSSFVLGLMLADLLNNKSFYFKKLKQKKLLMPIAIIGIFLGSYPNNRILTDTIYEPLKLNLMPDMAHFYHTIAAFLILITLLSSNFLKNVFSHKIFLFLGKISFSMYAIHFIVINSFSSFIFVALNDRFSYNYSFIITFIISNIFIFVFSYLVYKYIDLNGIRYSKLMYKKMFS